MSKKAVIFDLDGTLTDTLKSIWKSANLALSDVGLPPFEIDRYRYFVGDGAAELVKRALVAEGPLLAVNSNKPQERTVNVVEKNFGKGTFDILVGQSDERARKPAPDGVFYIMEQLGLVREEVIYLGDTCVDMKTGKSAGVYTVGALWGFRDRQELEENHADAIIEHPMELLKYL